MLVTIFSAVLNRQNSDTGGTDAYCSQGYSDAENSETNNTESIGESNSVLSLYHPEKELWGQEMFSWERRKKEKNNRFHKLQSENVLFRDPTWVIESTYIYDKVKIHML